MKKSNRKTWGNLSKVDLRIKAKKKGLRENSQTLVLIGSGGQILTNNLWVISPIFASFLAIPVVSYNIVNSLFVRR